MDPLEQGNEGLKHAVLMSPDPHIRRYAVLLLGSERDPTHIGTLVAALSDEDKGVRAQAAQALGELGKPAIGRLTMLLRHADWRVRYRAAEALGMVAEPESISALILSLTDENDHVRYIAAKSLGKLHAKLAVEPLISCLMDENEFVRKATAESLGAIGDVSSQKTPEKAGQESDLQQYQPR